MTGSAWKSEDIGEEVPLAMSTGEIRRLFFGREIEVTTGGNSKNMGRLEAKHEVVKGCGVSSGTRSS